MVFEALFDIPHIGALIIGIGFIRNPQNSIGKYSGPYINSQSSSCPVAIDRFRWDCARVLKGTSKHVAPSILIVSCVQNFGVSSYFIQKSPRVGSASSIVPRAPATLPHTSTTEPETPSPNLNPTTL